jgi:hypothetical protein
LGQASLSVTPLKITARGANQTQSAVHTPLYVTFRDVIDDLREQHDHHPSLEDQIKVLAAHHWVGTVPGESGPDLGKSDTEDTLEVMGLELDCTLDTAVDNLVTAGFLGSYEPDGPDWFTIRERDGEFVMGPDFPPAVHKECQLARDHIRSMDRPDDEDGTPVVADGAGPVKTNEDGETLREELVRKLEADIDPDELGDWLDVGTPQVRRGKLEDLVGHIGDSDTFDLPDSFDKINLIPKGYRYHRSEGLLHSY